VKVETTGRWNKQQYSSVKKRECCTHINKYSIPYNVFMFYFAAVITMMVKANCFYQQYLYGFDKGSSAVPDVTEPELFLFKWDMAHVTTWKTIWSTAGQFFPPFYGKTMRRVTYSSSF
jgi:hypothetical protein